ncbi:MAG: ATP-binding protein [Lachnospiraceae bacterium]|nr:ATP-binding protein [Lachnospiraceae bacterium]
MEHWGFANKFSYGNGISILLYGAPGTGKTMAAQVIAAELGKALYRVDLSGVISKYIGETQKNIAKIFDQTKQLNGILLFDEADALFARRNEVSDAQDKYSNAETAYLLQKIEESDGICILTTNLLQNFDEAFRRRITYMINFPMPDAALRKKIWENVFPKEAPVSEEVNFGLLAESFELSGAAIRNAALQSAWLSSVEEDCITMQGILGSVANEYRKLNKALKPEQKALMERFDALMF